MLSIYQEIWLAETSFLAFKLENALCSDNVARNGVSAMRPGAISPAVVIDQRRQKMSTQEENKSVVGRWFTNFWGKTCDLAIVDDIAAPDMLLQYSLHAPRRGREDVKAFMT